MDKKKLARDLTVLAIDTVIFTSVSMVVAPVVKSVIPKDAGFIKNTAFKIGAGAITIAIAQVVHSELAKNLNGFRRGIETGRRIAEEGTDGD